MDSPDAIRALATRGVAGVLVPNVVDAVAVAEGRQARRNSKEQQALNSTTLNSARLS